MALSELFEPWRAERVLFQDDALLVVDKPTGVPTHPPSPERIDDAHTRLLAWLRAQGAAEPYLGIHQRLDADTSGVLSFSRSREANPSLAEQFEGRRVQKTYVAVVQGARKAPDRAVLRHRIAPGEGGTMRALPARGRGGQLAVTHYRVVERVGDRALLELVPETGRTHQIRVQLAAAGMPIAGDTRYGGAPAPRLMLHAASLGMKHPTKRRPLRFEAPVPPLFAEWLRDPSGAELPDGPRLFERIREAAERRYAVAMLPDTNAFRLVNGAGDAVPGVTIDAYADYLVVSLSSDDAEARREDVLDAAYALGARGVYVKLRPKHASVIVDARSEQFAPRAPVRGEAHPEPFAVKELGLPFEVRLGDGLSTGIFLDQRENRRRVREMARGLRVLNLFAYTAPFTVAAVAGGAQATVSVDVSRTALAWAQRNLDAVGASPGAHRLVEADVLRWLASAERTPERFDLIVLDPPSFATTKTSRFAAESDYRRVAALALRLLAPGGHLLACTNHRGIVRAKLRRYLHEAAREADRGVAKMKDLPAPVDFPPEPGLEPHLKTVLVTIARAK